MQEHVNKRGDEVHSAWKTVTEDRAEVAISGSGCGVIDRNRTQLFATEKDYFKLPRPRCCGKMGKQ